MFKQFMTSLRRYAQQFPDVRKGGNHQLYTATDACLSAFGVFFTQIAFISGLSTRNAGAPGAG